MTGRHGSRIQESPRRSRRRVAIENLAFGYVAVAIAVIQGIVLVPLYLRVISVELYGAWLATGNVLAWIELVDPGVSSVLQQRVAFEWGRGDARSVAPIVGTGLVLSAAFALIPLAALPLSTRISSWVNLPQGLHGELALAFSIGIVSASLSLASQGLNSVNIGLQRATASGFVLTVATVIGVLVTVVGLLRGWGLVAIPLGTAGRAVLSLVGNAYLVGAWSRREGLLPRPSLAAGKAILATAMFSSVSRIGVTILTRADAFISARFLSPASTVALTLTGRASDVVRMVTDRVGVAAMPVVASLAGETSIPGARTGSRVVTRWVAGVSAVLIGIAIAWNEHFVRLWVGPDRFGGHSLTFLLGMYAAVATLLSARGQVLFAVGRIRAVAALTMCEAVARIAALAIWVPLVGLEGFALAGLSAALLVSSVMVPRALAIAFSCSASSEYGSLFRDLALNAAFAAFGFAISAAVPKTFSPGWLGLALAAALTGIALAAGVAVVDKVIRSEIVQRVRAVWCWTIRLGTRG